MPSGQLICDGCGQPADQEHIARRLKRLENMTRYRPIHVQALFLSSAMPLADADHLYSAVNEFRGEGLTLLRALGIDLAGKPNEAVLADFQRRGYLLAYILECPNQANETRGTQDLLEKQLGATAVRIRRSVKPKKLVLLGRDLDFFVEKLSNTTGGAELVVSQSGHAFRLEELPPGALEAAIRTTPVPSL